MHDIIFRYQGGHDPWLPVNPGQSSLKQISVGSAYQIWGVNNEDNNFKRGIGG
jgi:hypothetical protein